MKPMPSLASDPISVQKTIRPEDIRVLTSGNAGVIIPIWYAPVLREDSGRGSLSIDLMMEETVRPVMNGIRVRAEAHLVAFSAFPRFLGMDDFNRSYMKKPEAHNGTAIPFFQTVTYNKTHAFWKALGIQWKNTTAINAAPVEAYNAIVNMQRANRSSKLPLRTALDVTLAEAFWNASDTSYIVPDYESAMIDGEVGLTIVPAQLPVKSKSGVDTAGGGNTQFTMVGTAAANPNGREMRVYQAATTAADAIFAELGSQSIKLSLANIELAKKTRAFAALKDQYQGISEDHLVDLLMMGVRVPEEMLRQPQLLASDEAVIGQNERFATDYANIRKSVTAGGASLDLRWQFPAINTGGIILVTVSVVPEQIMERKKDTFLSITDPADLPDFRQDFLDPEKVEVVKNDFVDVEHGTPNGTFGYAPLNHGWKRNLPRLGGRFFRPNPDSFVEDRQRFWTVKNLNPGLKTDFYIVKGLDKEPFADTSVDSFEILARGQQSIVGNTQFGKGLEENNSSYAEILALVDQTRIVQS